MIIRLQSNIAVQFIVPLITFAFLTNDPATALARSTDADEARALESAEMKLAALAKEGKGEKATPPAEKKVAKKKQRPVRKKRVKASARKGKAAPARVATISSRRLTEGQVQRILSTTRDFSGSDMSGLNLAGADLSGARLTRANLQHANLERANLAESDLELADLSAANLRGASLNQARLRGTRMEGTGLDGALWIDKTICRKGSTGRCIE